MNDGSYCIARKLLKVARLKEARRWWWYCIRVRMENTYGDVEESHSGIRRVVLRNAVQWVHAPDAPSAYLTITRSRGARASIFRLKRPCSSHLSSFHHRPLAQPNRPQQASSITWIIQHHQMRRTRLTRSHYFSSTATLSAPLVGDNPAGLLLAISPPKRFITLERPVSMRLAAPAITGLAI